MAIFILIHGGAHGGWCWDHLVPELEKRGHRALAPDLPGMADSPLPISAATMPNWAKFVTDLARAQGEKVVLVGHSRGGPVIGEAAGARTRAVSRPGLSHRADAARRQDDDGRLRRS